MSNETEQLTLKNLLNAMKAEIQDAEHFAYSSVWMKKKLVKYFGKDIVFTDIGHRAEVVVTIKKRASHFLSTF